MGKFYSEFESNMGIDPNIYMVYSYKEKTFLCACRSTNSAYSKICEILRESPDLTLNDFAINSFYLYD